jgi:hypothetical protein
MDTPYTPFLISTDVVLRQVGGESLLLDLPTGRSFHLNEVAARMWQLLSEHQQVEPVVRDMLEEYDVDEARLRNELSILIDQLLQSGLLLRAGDN